MFDSSPHVRQTGAISGCEGGMRDGGVRHLKVYTFPWYLSRDIIINGRELPSVGFWAPTPKSPST